MLNSRGGYESDLIALRIDDNEYRLYVGTSAIKRDFAWLKRQLEPGEQVAIADVTEDYAVLALMGPKTQEIAVRLGVPEINRLGYFEFGNALVAGVEVLAARLSYVGEAGWEISCPARQAEQLFDALIDVGAKPAGVYAQTSMRVEKRFLAFGHDIDTDMNPIQAGLEFALDWDSEFIGRTALLEYRDRPPARKLVSIVLHDPAAQPLGNEPVCRQGRIIGKTTSAAFGYRVGKPVAIALVDCDKSLHLDGLEVDVGIAGRQNAGSIVTGCTYDPDGSSVRRITR
jgi:4-methylaminobutanoate oxidase (formaldehyde-forming)